MNIAYSSNTECSRTGSLISYLSPIVSKDLKCLNDSSELLGTMLFPPASEALATPLQNNKKITISLKRLAPIFLGKVTGGTEIGRKYGSWEAKGQI